MNGIQMNEQYGDLADYCYHNSGKVYTDMERGMLETIFLQLQSQMPIVLKMMDTQMQAATLKNPTDPKNAKRRETYDFLLEYYKYSSRLLAAKQQEVDSNYRRWREEVSKQKADEKIHTYLSDATKKKIIEALHEAETNPSEVHDQIFVDQVKALLANPYYPFRQQMKIIFLEKLSIINSK